MQELYTADMLSALRAQRKKRLLLLGIFSLVLLGLIVWSFLARVQVLSVALLMLLGFAAIFVLEMLCRPIRLYERLIEAALSGRSHTETMIFDHLEPDASLVDGISCRSLVFLGEADKHGTRDRMFYWDNRLPLPAFREGDSVSLRYTGKNIIGYEILSA